MDEEWIELAIDSLTRRTDEPPPADALGYFSAAAYVFDPSTGLVGASLRMMGRASGAAHGPPSDAEFSAAVKTMQPICIALSEWFRTNRPLPHHGTGPGHKYGMSLVCRYVDTPPNEIGRLLTALGRVDWGATGEDLFTWWWRIAALETPYQGLYDGGRDPNREGFTPLELTHGDEARPRVARMIHRNLGTQIARLSGTPPKAYPEQVGVWPPLAQRHAPQVSPIRRILQSPPEILTCRPQTAYRPQR
jgi:hypothetical protein